jgi:hypothetical protein
VVGGGGLIGGSEMLLALGLLQDGEDLADFALLHAVVVDEGAGSEDEEGDEEEEEELAASVEAGASGLWPWSILLFLEGAGGLVGIG